MTNKLWVSYLQKDDSIWPAGDNAPEDDEDYDEFARNDDDEDENEIVWTGEPEGATDLHVI